MPTQRKKILISQPQPSSGRSPYFDIAERFGFDIEFCQLIQTVSIEPTDFRQQRIDFNNFTAIVFTSKTIIDCFFELMKSLRVTIPDTMRYYCTSEAVSLYLQKYIVYRKRRTFFGLTGHTSELLEIMSKPSHCKEKFFIPISEDHSDKLPQLLEGTKLNYKEGIVYRTMTREIPGGLEDEYDVILFFSPYGINALLELIPNFKQGDKVIGSFGDLTTKAIEARGLRVDFNFTKATDECRSMAGALEYYLEHHASKKK